MKQLNFMQKINKLLAKQGFLVFLIILIISALSSYGLMVLCLGLFDNDINLNIARWIFSVTTYFVIVDLIATLILKNK
jgi:hypothetical protein